MGCPAPVKRLCRNIARKRRDDAFCAAQYYSRQTQKPLEHSSLGRHQNVSLLGARTRFFGEVTHPRAFFPPIFARFGLWIFAVGQKCTIYKNLRYFDVSARRTIDFWGCTTKNFISDTFGGISGELRVLVLFASSFFQQSPWNTDFVGTCETPNATVQNWPQLKGAA